MNGEITDKQEWLSLDGNHGTDFIPADLFDAEGVREILESDVDDEDYLDRVLAIVRDYTENTEAYAAELVIGYGVRSSASGYLDCTPWSVYTNKREAIKALNAENRACADLE